MKQSMKEEDVDKWVENQIKQMFLQELRRWGEENLLYIVMFFLAIIILVIPFVFPEKFFK